MNASDRRYAETEAAIRLGESDYIPGVRMVDGYEIAAAIRDMPLSPLQIEWLNAEAGSEERDRLTRKFRACGTEPPWSKEKAWKEGQLR